MIRGTTPTLEFTMPFDTSLIAELYITITQNGATALEKTLSDCNCNDTSVSLTLTESYAIAQGYHDGSGNVTIDSEEQTKLVSKNIREGITILGVKGSMASSEGMKPQSKTVTPSSTQQTVLPDEGYNCLSQVVVEKIPYVESENSAGGLTVTIG